MVGLFGLGALFLFISPELRGTVMGGIEGVGNYLAANSPTSYVCVGVMALVGAMVWVYRAAQPR